MGCFLGCLRIENDDCPPRSRPVRSKKRPEPVVSRNSLSSLFQREEDHKVEDQETHSSKSPSTINNELSTEAKFLKDCGTLNETPCEIRKARRRLIEFPPDDAESDRPKFHSWLPAESAQKLQPDELSPLHPVPHKPNEMPGEDLDSRSRSSRVSDVGNRRNSSISSTMASGEVSTDMPSRYNKQAPDNYATPLAPGLSVTDALHVNKSVRFECTIDMLSSVNDQNLRIYETPRCQIALKNSSYPTPLKLSGVMQTQSTVFPINVENLANGMPRIMSQYVHSVLNPVQNALQWKPLKEDRYDGDQCPDELRESLDQPDEYSLVKQEIQFKEASIGREMKVEASLSSWLKPPTSQQDRRRSQFYRTPGDRPIIGLVATYWKEDECLDNLPKVWDGNGIPNSTNKYKEDQKVSWHATPFEERLEMALSEESSLSQRKNLDGTPIAFDENEECDTAVSQQQPSVRPVSKPVASC